MGYPNRLSTKVIIAVAVMLLIDVVFGIAMHRTIATGTCSSTGYTQFGPAPVCPKGTALYGLVFPVAIVGTIAVSFVIGSNIAVPAMFVAIGAGSLLAGLASGPTSSGDKAFPVIFGGCFLIAGLGWGLWAAAAAWRSRMPSRPRETAPVASIAGLGPAAESAGSAHLPSIGIAGRLSVALVVWLAAVAGAIGIGKGLASAAGTTTTTTATATTTTPHAPSDITRAALPRPTGAAVIAATDPASLFRASNLGRALGVVTHRFGANENVLSVALYPGELELVVADNDGQAQLVSTAASGGLSVGNPVSFEGSRQAVNMSQLSAAVPQRLARQIAKRGGVATSQLDRFVLDLRGGLARWAIYTTGGGVHFEALLTGSSLKRISPGTTKALG